MNENQKIRSGNESENYQAGGDLTINQGMSFSEVKDVAMMVFEKNFIKLGEQVEELVNERAEKFIIHYLDKIRMNHPEALKNTIDPDIRAGIYEAQRDFVRSGKENIEDLLVDLLVERTTEIESNFKNIVMNEALSVASKLSKTQIDILSVSYLGKYISFTQPTHPQVYSDFIKPFQYLFDQNVDAYSDYSFLSYLGCLDISIGSTDFKNLILSKNLSQLTNEDELQDNLSSYPLLLKMNSFWDSNIRKIQNSTTTPVGSAIAMVNINRQLGYKVIPLLL